MQGNEETLIKHNREVNSLIMSFFEIVDTENAHSAIGTLDFLDRTSKGYTVLTTCNGNDSIEAFIKDKKGKGQILEITEE